MRCSVATMLRLITVAMRLAKASSHTQDGRAPAARTEVLDDLSEGLTWTEEFDEFWGA